MKTSLLQAKKNKKDEFYTQYIDIQNEMNAYIGYNKDLFRDKTILLPCDNPKRSNFTKFFVKNFNNFGLKRLISTSYTKHSKGRVLVLERGFNSVDIDNLEYYHLNGDGDFRSDEVKMFRSEADFIITNPPFSMFREFLAWIMDVNKKFIVVGHQNAITYKEVFPLIKNNKIWLGQGFKGNAGHFISNYDDTATAADHKEGMIRVSGVVWFTNVEHGLRMQPLELMTMEENIRNSKHKEIKNIGYQKYDNYDAIEVPYTDAIPTDYDGIMGVPISFLNKYCPEQFEILSCHEPAISLEKLKRIPNFKEYKSRQTLINGVLCQKTYHRIFIHKKNIW